MFCSRLASPETAIQARGASWLRPVRIITPAFADGLVFWTDSTFAMMAQSPVIALQAKWQLSLVFQMSDPPPCTFHVPPEQDAPPGGEAPPISTSTNPEMMEVVAGIGG